MSVVTPPISLPVHRFTTEQYHRMGDSGALIEDARVELLNGMVIDMSPIGSLHALIVRELNTHFSPLLAKPQRVILGVQDPIQVDEWNEPQPDLFLAKYRADRYVSGHPTPADLLLVIEVADSSLEKDSRVKIPLYARANVTEVWLVDANARTVTVHRNPKDGQYHDVQVFERREDRISPAALSDHELVIGTLFPE